MPDKPDAAEIIKKLEAHEKSTKTLRDRFEDGYKLWRLKEYKVAKKKGTYDNFTTNSPRTLAGGVIDEIAASRPKISIGIETEDKEERKALTLTERYIYGCFSLADARLEAIQQPSILEQLAWFAPVRGWVAIALLMWQEGDFVIPDVTVWDPFQTFWGTGRKGLLWGANRRYVSEEEIQDEFPDFKEYTANKKTKSIKAYDFYDKTWMGTIINKKWAEIKEHKLGYPPVYIVPVGATPYVESPEWEDEISDVGADIWENNRYLYPNINKLMSYAVTTVGMATHTPTVVIYKGPKPFQFNKDPYRKGNVIFISEQKVADIKEFIKPSLTQDAYNVLNVFKQEDSMGGMAPIAHGLHDRHLPVGTAQILTAAAMRAVRPRRKACEKAIKWMAQQFITQYKKKDFSKMTLQGVDSNNKRFRIEVAPEDILDKWEVDVQLIPKKLVDMMHQASIAKMYKEMELASDQTILDKVLEVEDPDGELEKLSLQRFRQLMDADLYDGMQKALDDKDYRLAGFLASLIHNRRMEQMQKAGLGELGSMPIQPGMTSSPTPEAMEAKTRKAMEGA